jgi:hypothetical protein
MQTHSRKHEILMQYWSRLKGARDMPSESQIDPDAIAGIWPSCFLISIDNVTERLGYRYSYLGRDLIEAYGGDVNNPKLAEKLLSIANPSILNKFDEVIAQRKPVIDESEIINANKLSVKYRSCLLPLGYNDQKVSHIIGCMSWRAYYIEPHLQIG